MQRLLAVPLYVACLLLLELSSTSTAWKSVTYVHRRQSILHLVEKNNLDPLEQVKPSADSVVPPNNLTNTMRKKKRPASNEVDTDSTKRRIGEMSQDEMENLVDKVNSIIAEYEGNLLEYLPRAMHIDFAKFFRKVMVLACLALPAAFSFLSLLGIYSHAFSADAVFFLKRYSSLICGVFSLLPTIFLAVWEKRIGQIPAVTNLMEWYIERQSAKCRFSLKKEEANYMKVIVEGYHQNDNVEDLMYKVALWRLLSSIDAEAMMLEVSLLHLQQDVAQSQYEIASSSYSQFYSFDEEEDLKQKQQDGNIVIAVQQILESSRQRGESKEETLKQLKEIQSSLENKR